ncbi:MAG TPA: hypothetical protein VGO40_20180 [Longimicrobium sp.]|jgi:hypothetical protein|nr:hypothetical protein [Longimicrobium sp.]
MSRRSVNLLLLGLIALDLVFPAVIFLSPGTWTRLFHDMPPDDPMGLLHRLGAGWAAFALWMVVARLRWERDPGWLMLVAGIRLTESWADWVYLGFAQHTTLFGTVSLLAASPVNLLCGWLLYRAYRRYSRVPVAMAPAGPAPELARV